MPDKFERFVAAYLRLNGYFTVPNFVIHAADDPTRISGGLVGNYTEVDTIGLRMPHSREVTGAKHIVNHPALVDGAVGKVDVVIAEVKSGNDSTPNRVWKTPQPDPAISYLVRFVGIHAEEEIGPVARDLASTFRFEDDRCRIRYVVFARQANAHYPQRGVTYMTFDQAISFIVEVRGQSWFNAGIGVASSHNQWDELLIQLFAIANKLELPVNQRVDEIRSMLAT
jgi:hypothetical protein